MARSIVVAVAGPSAAGKSTVVAELARRFGWAPVEEAYDRLPRTPRLTWTSEKGLRALEGRLLDEEARRFLEARSRAAGGRTVVADTSFLDPVGYTAGLARLGLASSTTFRAVLTRAEELAGRGRLGVADLTVVLSVPPELLRERAARDPRHHPPSLRARHEAVGRAEAAFVLPCWAKVLDGRVRVVRAVAPPGRVAERVRAVAEGTRPLGDASAAAVRALEALGRRYGLRPGRAARGNLKKGTLPPQRPR